MNNEVEITEEALVEVARLFDHATSYSTNLEDLELSTVLKHSVTYIYILFRILFF